MLNRDQKKDAIYLFCILGLLEKGTFLNSFGIIKNTKYKIQTQTQKIKEEFNILVGMLNLKDEDYDILVRDINQDIYKIECIHNSEIHDLYKKTRAETKNINMGDYLDLLEIAMGTCYSCSRNIKACKLRKVLKKLDVEPLDPDKENKCEFCYKRGD